jgi:uncharacterized protein YjbJ (UPF0337 family)
MMVEILKNWNKMKGHLKREFPMLNNNDVTQRTGKDEEMLQIIMDKTKQTREQLEAFLLGVQDLKGRKA